MEIPLNGHDTGIKPNFWGATHAIRGCIGGVDGNRVLDQCPEVKAKVQSLGEGNGERERKVFNGRIFGNTTHKCWVFHLHR
jgi:hypothetical protein